MTDLELEFDDYLNDKYNNFDIDNTFYTPAFVIYHTDINKYKELFKKWKEVRNEEKR